MDKRSIAAAIGRRKIAQRLGVGAAAVSMAVNADFFPASWYPCLKALGAEAGVAVPAALFRWKGDPDASAILDPVSTEAA